MDDAALLLAYSEQHSEQAFRELVRRHLPVVHAAALRQVNGDAHLAQDVAQRVFISFARKAAQLTRQPAIVGWLYTAARLEAARAVRTELRRRRREQQAVMNSPDPEPPALDPLGPILDEAMSDLGHADREAVLLRYFSGRSFGEIGEALRISEDAARKRVDRALDKLRDALGRRGFASTAAALGGVLTSHAAPPVLPAVAAAVTTGACAQLGAGSAIPLALLMSSTKTVVLAASLVAAAGAWYWHDHRAWQHADEQRAAAQAEVAAANLREPQQLAELATAQRELADAEKAVATPPPAPAAVGRVPAYLTDARYRELSRASSRARFHLEFQRLYRQLNLTPEQIDTFEAVMARQHEAQLDAAIARATGQDVQTVFQRSGAAWSESMRQLLGDDGFKQLDDYLKTMPVRAFLDRFAVQSAAVGPALTPAQSDQLATLALANDVMYRQGKGTDPGTVNWNAVWDPATKLLTPDQLALLQRSVEVWSLQKQLSLRLKKDAPPRT